MEGAITREEARRREAERLQAEPDPGMDERPTPPPADPDSYGADDIPTNEPGPAPDDADSIYEHAVFIEAIGRYG